MALQSSAKGWNWGFHSCNGLSASADVRKWKDPALWKDVLRVHERIPLHALVGGGDQIYNDALWATPSMKAWLDIPNTEVIHTYPPQWYLIMHSECCCAQHVSEDWEKRVKTNTGIVPLVLVFLAQQILLALSIMLQLGT